MAIKLRYTPIDTGGKTSELTYQEMNDNLKTFYYSSSFDVGSSTLEMNFLSGSTSHSIDLSSLAGADSYISNVNLNGGDLEITGIGSAFNGTIDLNAITASGYLVNSTRTLAVKGSGIANAVGNYFTYERDNGTTYNLVLPGPNQGGMTIAYRGVEVGKSSWSSGEPNYMISTDAAFVSASGVNEWHFSDLNRGFSSIGWDSGKSVWNMITGSVTDSEQMIVRMWDDGRSNVELFFTNSGSATTGNQAANGEDLILNLELIGGRQYGHVANNASPFVDGTFEGPVNVSFEIIGSGGGGGGVPTSPGGSDTQVQFNDGGAFGGDPNFTWNKTQNQLTLIGNNNTPSLRLSSSIAFPSADQVLGELVGYSGVSDSEVGGIAIKSDGAFSNGDVPTRLEFSTTPDGTEVPTVKLQIKENGQLIADEYGSGTFTGTAAKWLAVDSSGNIIEEDTPSGGSFTRPGSDTSITYDTYLNSLNYVVDQVGTSPAAPNANGDVSIRYVGSNIGSNVDRIDVYKTDGGGSSQSTTLENLATSGSIILTQVGAGGHTERYRIDSTPTDNSTYMSYPVVWESGDDAAFTTGLTMTSTFDSDYEYELATGYNRLLITNNSNSVSQRFRMVKPTSAAAGDEVIVELKVNTSGQNVKPVYQVRNGSSLFVKMRTVTEIDGTTVSEVNLDTNDVAIMRFQVNDLGSIEGLTLLGANQMIYA